MTGPLRSWRSPRTAPTDALTMMRATATREDATEKNAVTPGPLAPARELLGDMLLQMKKPAEALVEYQATMKKEPNRFRGVYGAAKAASLAGDRAAAKHVLHPASRHLQDARIHQADPRSRKHAPS